MSVFESQYFPSQKPASSLLVFLHGYNNTRDEMRPVYEYLQQKLPGLAIAAPEGGNVSQKDPARKSWYKVSGFDTENRRRLEETPVEEIAKIYNQAGQKLFETAMDINFFIDDMQKKYGFRDKNTYIAGFSQGAMLAIWTALIRMQELAGCFSFSGLAAADEHLDLQIVSRPTVYLLHGKKDQTVLFKCLDYTKKWLQQENIPVAVKIFNTLDHQILPEELDFVAGIIGKK